MSFEFIDLNKSFLKTVTEVFAAFLIDNLRGQARADNINSFINKIG